MRTHWATSYLAPGALFNFILFLWEFLKFLLFELNFCSHFCVFVVSFLYLHWYWCFSWKCVFYLRSRFLQLSSFPLALIFIDLFPLYIWWDPLIVDQQPLSKWLHFPASVWQTRDQWPIYKEADNTGDRRRKFVMKKCKRHKLVSRLWHFYTHLIYIYINQYHLAIRKQPLNSIEEWTKIQIILSMYFQLV